MEAATNGRHCSISPEAEACRTAHAIFEAQMAQNAVESLTVDIEGNRS